MGDPEKNVIAAPTLKEQGYLAYRYLVAFMAFCGMIFNYVLRININLAITAMVAPRNTNGTNSSTEYNECGYDEVEDDSYNGVFEWDEFTQGLVLGSFFWGYLWTQLPGGRLAELIGARRVFGFAILGAALMTLLEPAAAYLGYVYLIIVRVIMGLMTGVTFPSMHALLSCWAPPQERALMSAMVYAGSQAGTVLGYPLTGALIQGLGWEWVFYIEGLMALVWVAAWFVLVTDSPKDARWISDVEKTYIMSNINEVKHTKPLPIPWRKVITSWPMWAILVADIGNNWGFYTLLTDLPIYMKEMLKQDIQSNSLLSGGPYLFMWVFSNIIGAVMDKLIKNNILSRTTVRKLATSIAHFGSAICLLCVTFVECDRTATIVLLFLAVGANGAIYSGFMINHMDIAPNFAGSMFGITNGAAAIPGFLAPMTVGALTQNNQTLAQWSKVFYIAFTFYVIDAIFYLIFASGVEQEWNRYGYIEGTDGVLTDSKPSVSYDDLNKDTSRRSSRSSKSSTSRGVDNTAFTKND